MPEQPIVDAAVRAVRAQPGWPRLRVLDLSCGDGQVLEALARGGCPAEGTHFRPDDYIYSAPSDALRKAVVHEGVDLTRPLPFADGAYDVVLATEVIEHLPSVVALFAEVGRILKDGGCFIFSTPNIHRLQSRLRFLLSGQHELRSARIGWDTPPENLYSTHHNPAYFPTLHAVLHFNRLHIERLAFTQCSPWALLLAPLYPIICAATALETRHARKRSREGGRDLLRWSVDVRMLFSDQLMVVARKAGPPRPGAAETHTP